MEKIRSKAATQLLAQRMMQDSSFFVQLWDEMDSNRIIHVEMEDSIAYIGWEDTVNGEAGRYMVYPYEITRAIWENRKYINASGQLESRKIH